jgi:hypothetical protein
MKPISCAHYRFPPEIIWHAIWLYLRITLSYRDVEDLLAERGLTVSNESIRRWVLKIGPLIAKNLRTIRPKAYTRRLGDERFLGRRRRLLLQGALVSVGFLRAAASTTACGRFFASQVKAVLRMTASSQARGCSTGAPSNARKARMQASCTTSSASVGLPVSQRASV